MSERSGLADGIFMSTEQARQHYNLVQREPSIFASDLELQLYEQGVAAIEMSVSKNDFDTLLKLYEVCIEECPQQLAETYHSVDRRFGNDAGQVRKERKVSKHGIQINDPKNYFHFNEHARKKWTEQFTAPPQDMAAFLEAGYDIHSSLIDLAREQFGQLEDTHPNIQRAYFLGHGATSRQIVSHSYMRLLRYDGYDPEGMTSDVAKPHFDIGGATIQAYADAPGFWGAPDGPDGERIRYDTIDGKAYMFMGRGHEHLYGKEAEPRPLYHGVERIIPEGAKWVTERHAVILFVDAPLVDYGTKPEDTLPYLSETAPAA